MATLLQIGFENAATATVLAALAAILARGLRGRPALIHCLYLVVLIKLVTPPLWRVPLVSIPEPSTVVFAENPENLAATYEFVSDKNQPDANTSFEDEEARDSTVKFSSVPMPILVAHLVEPQSFPILASWVIPGATWVAGSVVALIVAVRRIQRFRRVLGLVEPAPESVEDLVADVAERIELSRTPRVGMVAGTVSPMVWCLGLRPFLILPGELWKRLDDRQRRTLLAHELAHLKRGDHWVRLFELAVTVLFWWLPVVWWVRKGLRDAEEQCCDAWVVWAFPEASKAYAETLVETVDFLSGDRSPVPAFASGIGRIQHLKRRLSMIMKGTTPHTLGYPGTLAAFAIGALLLPLSPTLAQQPEEKKEIRVIVNRSEDDSNKEAKISSDVNTTVNVITEDLEGPQGDDIHIVVRDTEDGKEPDPIKTFTFKAVGDQGAAMKMAIDQLRKQVDEMKAKNEKSPGDEMAINALTAAMKSLARQNVVLGKIAKAGKPAIANFSGDVFSQLYDGNNRSADLSPEKKARREELLDRMKKLKAEADERQRDLQALSRQMAETHKQLAEASRQLASLDGRRSNYTITRPMTIEKWQLQRPEAPVPPVPPAAPAHLLTPMPAMPVLPAMTGRAPSDDQDRRIRQLEKQLERVLDRLESLNKGDKKQGTGRE